MRPDYRRKIQECAAIPCRAEIQIGHSQFYRGKYNGKLSERLIDLLVARHVPMPKLMSGTWGGKDGEILSGSVFTQSRFDRQVYRLDRGRYWVRGEDPEVE